MKYGIKKYSQVFNKADSSYRGQTQFIIIDQLFSWERI
jgi:hypothetical protein